MSAASDEDPFYIGYLPKAPDSLKRFLRKTVLTLSICALAIAGLWAVALPYFGVGMFDFGNPREFAGTLRCETAPRLVAADADYLLVGYGKNGIPPEFCGASGSDVTLKGTLIQREGRKLIEVSKAASTRRGPASAPELTPVPLGHFTLIGEVVDSKCYFGVMNPAEGRAHRACAVQCLRGGVPAVFVARDRAGSVAHLLVTGPTGQPINDELLRWVGEGVEVSGEVVRQGRWLVLRLDSKSVRLAR